jgi:catechol 2,3-dioxygenase-like lactoylglutathione lyase family enzyme
MFSHVTLGTDNLPRAIAFYDRLLEPLGLHRHSTELEAGLAGYGTAADATPQLWIMRPLDRRPATVGNGVTVALEARSRDLVRAVHAAGLAAGGTDEGGPGLRPHYHPDFYGAYLRDPDGNKLCCVCHAPA